MHTLYICSKSSCYKKEAKYLFNLLYSFFEQKNNMDNNLSKTSNYIKDKIEQISFPKFLQSTLDNHIKQ
jgi:hypothetical protein